MKSKILLVIGAIFLLIAIVFNVIVYNTSKNNTNVKSDNLTSRKTISTSSNNVWCGTFNLVWNELMDYLGGDVEFEGEQPEIAIELNKRKFTKEMLSEKDYYIKNGKATPKLKEIILKDIKEKFNEESDLLEGVDFDTPNGIAIYAMLIKEFKFLEKFDNLEPREFMYSQDNFSEEKIEVFGIDDMTKENVYKNVEVLYADGTNTYDTTEYAVKLKTKENEEVILFATDDDDSYENIYKKLQKETKNYTGNKKFEKVDSLYVPVLNVDVKIKYDELCGKYFKNREDEYICEAMQTIKFNLDSNGGKLKSEAVIITDSMSCSSKTARTFNFCRPCYVFLKEEGKEQFYFAMKIKDLEFLKKCDL